MLILLLIAVIGTLPSTATTNLPLCSDSPQQVERTRALVEKGLETALVEHTAKLFRVWLSVGAEGRERAAEGLRNEVRGYLYAQKVVDAWVIPPCKK